MSREERRHQTTIAEALAKGAAAKSAIAASWARSASFGLSPSDRLRHERLDERSLMLLRQRMAPLLRAARPTMERLFQAVGGFGASVLLASHEGIAVERIGKASEDKDFAEAGLWTGTLWTEAAVGTNAIGTCLTEGRPVTIHRNQHFLSHNIGLSCISAPIHDSEGKLRAVLDVSTVRKDLAEAFMPLISQSVADAARRVEADLFAARFAKARMVLVPNVLGGLLAVDADELVIGANRAAKQALSLSGDLARNPLPLGDLLGLYSHQRPDEGERAVLTRAIARAGGNLSAAARALGISRATLHRKLARDLSQS